MSPLGLLFSINIFTELRQHNRNLTHVMENLKLALEERELAFLPSSASEHERLRPALTSCTVQANS